MGKGKLKNFIKKAGEAFPDIINAGTMLASGNVVGAIGVVGDVLKSKAASDDNAAKLLKEFDREKEEMALEAYKLEIQDRQSARDLYKSDNLIQKIFAIAFLIGYAFLSWYLIEVLTNKSEIPDLAETLITMIWTGTSTKLGTVVDFLFGGSMPDK